MDLVDTGIDGLNIMLGGGIPKGNSTLVLGSYGAGKTTLGIHFIYAGLKRGERVAYFSLEERKDSILKAASQYGMNLESFLDSNLVLMNPGALEFVEMLKLKENFKKSIEEEKVSRIVIDSISIMMMAADSDVQRRNIIMNLSESLKDLEVTSLFIAETEVGQPYSSREKFAEFVVDGVISLQNVYNDRNGDEVSLVRVLKMRFMNHDRKARPYVINEKGIQIMAKSEIFMG